MHPDSNVNDITLKKAGFAILFYLVSIATVFALSQWSPSGPCTPGLAILGFLFLLFSSPCLFLLNLVRVLRGDKTNTAALVIHFIAVIGLFLFAQ